MDWQAFWTNFAAALPAMLLALAAFLTGLRNGWQTAAMAGKADKAADKAGEAAHKAEQAADAMAQNTQLTVKGTVAALQTKMVVDQVQKQTNGNLERVEALLAHATQLVAAQGDVIKHLKENRPETSTPQ